MRSLTSRIARLGGLVLTVIVAFLATPRAQSEYCYDACYSGVACSYACMLSQNEWITCGEWGTCDVCAEFGCGDAGCQAACGESSSNCSSDCPVPVVPGPSPACTNECVFGSVLCQNHPWYVCNEHNCCVQVKEDPGDPGKPATCTINQDCSYPQEICVDGKCVDNNHWRFR